MALTNRELYFETLKEIKEKSFEISKSEIFLLLEKANNLENYSQLTLNFDKNVANLNYFFELKQKLFNGLPIQYILNEAPFINLNVYVDERVLIPRVETEELVLRTCDLIKKLNIKNDSILDMCTGSGCIALYLKKSFPDSNIFASDISFDALDVAKKNAENFKLDINFVQGDKLEPFIKVKKKFDVIISNPPYVENKNDIEEKVKNNEPMNAIYSEDGTAFYEEVFKHYKDVLNDNFLLAFEINYDQKEKLTSLLSKYFEDGVCFSFVKDIYDRVRFLFVSRGYEL